MVCPVGFIVRNFYLGFIQNVYRVAVYGSSGTEYLVVIYFNAVSGSDALDARITRVNQNVVPAYLV